MTDIYTFRPGPTYRTASSQELFESAMAQPLSRTSTFFDQAKGGILESFGLGTAIRSFELPEEAPDQQGIVVQPTDGSPDVVAPDTPQMRRRITAAGGEANTRQETPVELATRRDEAGALDESQYKASAFYRDGVPWDRGMTQARAEALAEMFDAKQVRDFYAQKRPFASFLGNLTGQALDPINYVPVAGPLVKAAAVARFGTIGGAVLHSALDAAANTAVFGGLTADQRAVFGDDVSWQSTISQIATAALIGGAFGAVGGAIGRRADALKIKEAENRLATLKATQEARIALNEGIDAVVRGEDLRLSPNATDPMARIAAEVQQLDQAYDRVRAEPTGDVRDPLVTITPEDIEGTIVARGTFKNINETEVSRRGWGLVKIIWRHGEESGRPEDLQIRKDDITALPSVVREYDPSSVSSSGNQREWRVRSGDRTVVYADSVIDGERHVVTAYVQDPKQAGAELPLSEKRKPAAAGSSSDALNALRDTEQGLSLRAPDGQPRTPATPNIARPAAIDNTVARPDPAPDGLNAAEARSAKPDGFKEQAEQYRINPETGAFPEEEQIAQLATEGRLTPEDAEALAAAQADLDTGNAYAEALKSVARCVL